MNVLDRNDEPPQFTQHFSTQVPENVPIGYTVLKITSTDADIGENAIATYSLLSNPGESFALDSLTGVVVVHKELDFESKREYILRASANDGAFNSETAITIDILDANDHAPEFRKPSYSFDLVEGLEVGYKIGEVSASDRDSTGHNSNVFYTWREPSSILMLNTENGAITTLQAFNYQPADSNMKLHAVATDRGEPALSSQITVTINLRPANQYIPVFDDERYVTYVDEISDVDLLITTVHAT